MCGMRKGRKKNEAELQSVFTSWLRGDGGEWVRRMGVEEIGGEYQAAAFELKVVMCEGEECGIICRERFAFSKLQEGQIEALLRAAGVGSVVVDEGGSGSDVAGVGNDSPRPVPIAFKISDMAAGWKPFDCFYMSGCGAWLVIGWACGVGAHRARLYAIRPGEWVRYRAGRERGSVSETVASQIGVRMPF